MYLFLSECLKLLKLVRGDQLELLQRCEEVFAFSTDIFFEFFCAVFRLGLRLPPDSYAMDSCYVAQSGHECFEVGCEREMGGPLGSFGEVLWDADRSYYVANTFWLGGLHLFLK